MQWWYTVSNDVDNGERRNDDVDNQDRTQKVISINQEKHKFI